MSDKIDESEKSQSDSTANNSNQANEKMFSEVERDTSGKSHLAKDSDQRDSRELREHGFPNISIIGDVKPIIAPSVPVPDTKSAKVEALEHEAAEPTKWPDECKVPDIEDSGAPYFRDDVSVIGMGDDHAGNHWEGYTNALETLSKEGLTHVALEMIPNDLNSTIKDYREAKEKLEKADANDRAELEKNIEDIKEKIRKGLDSLGPKDKSSLPPGMMNADDLIKMIDMAHDKGIDVVGIEPKDNNLADVLNGLKDGTDKDGNSIDADLRDSAKQAFLDYFNPNSSDPERSAARDILDKFLNAKFSESNASEYLKWMEEARLEGLSIPSGFKFPADDQKDYGDIMKPQMNWRDTVFAREIGKLMDNGAKVFVMAGSGHFTKSEGLCDAFKEYRKGVTTLAERLGKKLGHIRSGHRPGQ